MSLPPSARRPPQLIYAKFAESINFYHGPSADPHEILEEYTREAESNESGIATVSVAEIFHTRYYRWPAALSVVCWLGVCLGGLDVAQQYSTGIMISASVEQKDAQLYTALILLLPTVFISVISSLLADRLGRRPLLLTGLMLMTIGEVMLFLSGLFHSNFCSVSGLGFIMIGFSIGTGPISGVLPSELCPHAIRGVTVSLATGTNFLLSYIILITFPPLKEIIGCYVYIPLIVSNFLCLIFLAKFLPETKGRSVWDIGRTWRDENEEEPLLNVIE